MEIIIPVSGTIGTGQRDNHQRLQNLNFLLFLFLALFLALLAQESLNGTGHLLQEFWVICADEPFFVDVDYFYAVFF